MTSARRGRLGVLALGIFLLVLAACSGGEGAASRIEEQEVLLTVNREHYIPDTFFSSPDLRRASYAAKVDELRFTVVDGIESPSYDRISAAHFSPDSSRTAYVAKREDGSVVIVVDGVESAGYTSVVGAHSVFSPDSQRVVFGAERAGDWFMVADGAEGPSYDEVSTPVFSPDGSRLAYVARVGTKWTVVVDGQERGRYDLVPADSLKFSPQGNVVGYSAKQNGGWFVVIDGVRSPPYEALGRGSPVFSPDGDRAALHALKDDRWHVVIDGQTGPAYDEVSVPAFSLIPGPSRTSLAEATSRWRCWMAPRAQHSTRSATSR